MTEHTQLTTDGAQEPLQRPVPHRSPEYVAVPLFTAPQTMRGQLHMATDTPSLADHARQAVAELAYLRAAQRTLTPSELHAAARCARLQP